jgi:hypothetical protein
MGIGYRHKTPSYLFYGIQDHSQAPGLIG